MAQAVRHLPYEHEDPSSSPSTHIKSWVCWTVLIIPALGKWGQKVLRACGQLALPALQSSGPTRDSYLKRKKIRAVPKEGHLKMSSDTCVTSCLLIKDTPPHTHMRARMHAHSYS